MNEELNFEKMKDYELVKVVNELDDMCGVLMRYDLWDCVDSVNELGSEVRFVLEGRGIKM